jgi:hypothetical protein
MTTLKELAERREHLSRKIGLLEDLITMGYSPDNQLKAQFGEVVHDEVLSELDEKWLEPLRAELAQLENMEIDDGSREGGSNKPGTKSKSKTKGKKG